MHKRIILLFTFILLGSQLIFSAGKKESATFIQEIPLIGMATDSKGLGDQSFNDAVYSSLKGFEEDELIDLQIIEPESQTEFALNLKDLAEEGAQLIFAVGFLFIDAVMEIAPQYPEVTFVAIDNFFDPLVIPSNVIGVNWKENEVGYLSGVVAGLMTKDYAFKSDLLNDKNIVGAILGMDIPPCQRFFAGFVQGAQSVNPSIEILDLVVGDFSDPSKGKLASEIMAERGADIVFNIAGFTGMGIYEAAVEKQFLAIGIDVDQNFLAPDYIITSAMKGAEKSTDLIINGYLNGQLETGQNILYGLKEEAIGLAPFHGFDSLIPEELLLAVEQAKLDILEGLELASHSDEVFR